MYAYIEVPMIRGNFMGHEVKGQRSQRSNYTLKYTFLVITLALLNMLTSNFAYTGILR